MMVIIALSNGADSYGVSMSGDCRNCKDYRDCSGIIEWFHYGLIKFCPYQIVWVLANSETLRAGKWPKEPYNSDSAGQRTIKTEASFTKPILILAEVETRLKKTGIQGKLLVAQIEAGRDFNNLDRDARTALMYIKGFRR